MQVFRHIPSVASSPAALAIGNFDGVHLGHRAIFDALRDLSRKQGLTPCVMTFEPHPREFFSPETAPVRLTSLREKLELFADTGAERVYVVHFNRDFAALNADDFMHKTLRALDARLLLLGDDFRFGAGRQGDVAQLRAGGFTVESVPDITLDGARISSTAVREALAAGDMARAGALLGRPYSVSGRVVDGDKLGRQLGYPTANIFMPHEWPPLFGVYAVKLSGADAHDAELAMPGVASFGVRPTMKNNGKATLEVHLFDFNGDIYGRHVRVHFLKKLRAELKFPDLDSLKRQIALDELAARDYFATENR